VDQGDCSPAQRLQKIAAYPAIHPIQESPLITKLLEGPDDLLSSGRRDKEKGPQQTRDADLIMPIGRLTMELG
jgi:hypothetical protein